MARTHRSPDQAFAGPGAVAQHGGKLPIYICNECQAEVVWVESERTGRKYLANISHGANGHRFYIGRNIHTCGPIPGLTERSVAELRAAIADAEAIEDDRNAAAFATRNGFCIERMSEGGRCGAPLTGSDPDLCPDHAEARAFAAREREQELAAFAADPY